MSSLLYRIGHGAAQRPGRVIAAWVAAAILVAITAATAGAELEDSFDVPGLDSQRAVDLLSEAGNASSGLTAQVVTTPMDATASFTTPGVAADQLAELQAEIEALPNVVGVTDTAGAAAAGDVGGIISQDGRIALLRVQYLQAEDLNIDDLENLKEVVSASGTDGALQVEMGGELSFAFEEAETGVGEMIGLIAAVIVLLVAFGSVIAMGLPIGVALFGLAVGISSMSLLGHLIDVPSWAPQIASMVGLGVGIDYALFLITRHRELLGKGVPVAEAVGRSVATAGRAVLFAGGTVVIAILGLGVAGVRSSPPLAWPRRSSC